MDLTQANVEPGILVTGCRRHRRTDAYPRISGIKGQRGFIFDWLEKRDERQEAANRQRWEYPRYPVLTGSWVNDLLLYFWSGIILSLESQWRWIFFNHFVGNLTLLNSQCVGLQIVELNIINVLLLLQRMLSATDEKALFSI